ncbi:MULTISPECIES: hypothetical protein [unclassified Bradyrhizobium]|uniref:hypothetical protein n=1 Tax=unclassified Bradyrhizobium TaxID=2631580 RepID=UPI0024799A28|nr:MULTISPECIES: hypothetical protein [unclassified Bradyrhizobium]WGR75367.1 hypothetical protein MTX24_07605 [Bradyrhizobium sp. ISRA426]WGR82994.1 hypothetical protein MTX21_32560 [Bradyrhizobium sp. ISRA430]WGR90571.1 hypothetical protein MTX25_07610 [Bradyrhizobium sp. ISRA432]
MSVLFEAPADEFPARPLARLDRLASIAFHDPTYWPDGGFFSSSSAIKQDVQQNN